MREMTENEWAEFLRAGTRTAKLAIILPSGRPTVVPVWFIYGDDGVIRIETGVGSAKAKALAADPRACLLVDLEEPPYAFVKIDATARLVDDPDLVREIAAATGARYMGPERADEFAERNGGPGQVVIEFTPTRVVAMADVSG